MGHAAAETFQCGPGARKRIRVAADQHGQFPSLGLRPGPADRTIEQVYADTRQLFIGEFFFGEREGAEIGNDQATSSIRRHGRQRGAPCGQGRHRQHHQVGSSRDFCGIICRLDTRFGDPDRINVITDD